jgi:hypothetical protein
LCQLKAKGAGNGEKVIVMVYLAGYKDGVKHGNGLVGLAALGGNGLAALEGNSLEGNA